MIAATTSGLVPGYLLPTDIPADSSAVVAFDGSDPAAVIVPLRQLGPRSLSEVWNVRSDEVFLGSAVVAEDAPLEQLSRELYSRLIDEIRSAGYPYFLRLWNHIGSINQHEGGVERYQLFCAGRHDAFVRAGYHHGADLPAASAVGMPGRGIVTYFLASRQPGVQIENPRQVAAYDYPPQYGSKSPSFSRATMWGDTLFVSGTSSVIGHSSVHPGNLQAQLDETLRNLEIVIGRAIAGGGLQSIAAAKTYVRCPDHYDAIASRIDTLFPSNIYLQADICRAELLLEIEAVAVR